MKKLRTVFSFELSNYVDSKSYKITTVLIALIIAVIMFLPRFVDMSEFLGTDTGTAKNSESTEDSVIEDTDKEESDEDDYYHYVIYDKAGVFKDLSELEQYFDDSKWAVADSVDEVKQAVKEQDADGGFVVLEPTRYEHYVYNKDLSDYDADIFNELLSQIYRETYCEENNLDIEEVMQLVYVPVEGSEEVLGKDMRASFAYCYIMVILVFMIIILYCVMIATSVTNEKSNRSIEVLVTSTTPNSLIFGKVLAGTLASFLQVAVILLIAIGGYSINRDYWGGILDNVLNIPANVLVAFGLFGVFGFIFYAFIYAAVGALVSKTEDLNKSVSGVQMIIMVVYFIVLLQMSNIDGTVMKIMSFLPISSYSAMYIRVAMGEVAVWEIVVSFLILLASNVGVGYIAAKIYRMGTLRYGNPISIRSALKSIKNKSAE